MNVAWFKALGPTMTGTPRMIVSAITARKPHPSAWGLPNLFGIKRSGLPAKRPATRPAASSGGAGFRRHPLAPVPDLARSAKALLHRRTHKSEALQAPVYQIVAHQRVNPCAAFGTATCTWHGRYEPAGPIHPKSQAAGSQPEPAKRVGNGRRCRKGLSFYADM